MELLRTLEAQSRARLPLAVYDYFAGGAGDEQTLADNERAWRQWWLVPEQMAGTGTPDLGTTVLGQRMSAPLVLAPAAAQRLLHPDGELAAARAAARAGLVYCLSTRATTDLADVAAATPGAARWFQLYVQPDRGRTAQVLARLADHGYGAVVLTLDLPVGGRREREDRNGPIPMPDGVIVVDHLGQQLIESTKPVTGGWAALSWDDVAWVADRSKLPVICKGVVSARDGRRAVDAGAAAVVVSNHGGRQLDGCVPTAVALPDVAAEIGADVPVLVDGGIRSGEDIARALALGATAALIGRPYLWGLAAGGGAGVTSVLDAFIADLRRTLILLGVSRPADLDRTQLRPRLW